MEDVSLPRYPKRAPRGLGYCEHTPNPSTQSITRQLSSVCVCVSPPPIALKCASEAEKCKSGHCSGEPLQNLQERQVYYPPIQPQSPPTDLPSCPDSRCALICYRQALRFTTHTHNVVYIVCVYCLLFSVLCLCVCFSLDVVCSMCPYAVEAIQGLFSQGLSLQEVQAIATGTKSTSHTLPPITSSHW